MALLFLVSLQAGARELFEAEGAFCRQLADSFLHRQVPAAQVLAYLTPTQRQSTTSAVTRVCVCVGLIYRSFRKEKNKHLVNEYCRNVHVSHSHTPAVRTRGLFLLETRVSQEMNKTAGAHQVSVGALC